MRPRLFLLFAWISFSIAVIAWAAGVLLAEGEDRPMLLVDPQFHDFGRVPSTFPLTASVHLENCSDSTVTGATSPYLVRLRCNWDGCRRAWPGGIDEGERRNQPGWPVRRF